MDAARLLAGARRWMIDARCEHDGHDLTAQIGADLRAGVSNVREGDGGERAAGGDTTACKASRHGAEEQGQDVALLVGW